MQKEQTKEKKEKYWKTIFCAPFTNCISSINNIQIDNGEYIGVVIWMFNLIGFCDNYSKASENLRQYYRDDANDNMTLSQSFKYKFKITGKTPATFNTEDVKRANH